MRELRVHLRFAPEDERPVGTLVEDARRVWFAFDEAFLRGAIEISPYALPRSRGPLVEHRVKVGVPIHGVFDDARPDGWGLKLLHRALQRAGTSPSSLSPLDELAFLGDRTMGALVFEPATGPGGDLADAVALAELARHAQRVYDDAVTDVLPDLVRAAASSGGARPKALIGLRTDGAAGVVFGEGELPDGWEAYIVKFPTSRDDPDAGRRERAWMLMADAAGVEVPRSRVLPLKGVGDAFAVRRFDRPGGGRRLHMLSAAAALDVDFRTAVTDYGQLLRLAHLVCEGDQSQLLALFRLAAFNVAAVNQDDHLRNLAFVLEPERGWRLSPGYDLTWCPLPLGERATLVGGEGRDVRRAHLLSVAEEVGLRRRAGAVIDEVLGATARVTDFLVDAGCTGSVSRQAAASVLAASEGLA